jgi:Raf kinase inhibitor-like YbhB/YbcL family protein
MIRSSTRCLYSWGRVPLFVLPLLLPFASGGDLAGQGVGAGSAPGTGAIPTAPAPIQLTSPAFQEGGAISLRNTAYGENLSPALEWNQPPEGTESFVLIMHDRDAPVPGGFVHWVVYNIPGSARGLPEGLPPEVVIRAPDPLAGTTQGPSEMRSPGYYGPRPQAGDRPHTYVFTLYATSSAPDLPPNLGRNQVLSLVRDRIVGQGVLTGTFARE